MVRIFITESSVWSVDEAAKEFRRAPRVPGAAHLVAYAGEWTPYSVLEEVEAYGHVRTTFWFDPDHVEFGPYLTSGWHVS